MLLIPALSIMKRKKMFLLFLFAGRPSTYFS